MSSEETVYRLNNGNTAREQGRLNNNQDIFRKLTHDLLPENIKTHLSSLGHPPAVADVCTGTGIWLKDLAETLPPTARLDGYDFDTSKFLDAAQVPANVKFSFADALKPFPERILGTYDLVHVRLLLFALTALQWREAAGNLRTLLRPGGYLMWEDSGYTTWQCLPLTESWAKMVRADVQYAISVGRDIMSPLPLKGYFESVGLTDCTRQEFLSFEAPKDLQKLYGKVIPAGVAQSMHGIVDRGGFEWIKTHEDVDEVTNAVIADIDNGVTQVGFAFYWTIGQNPK